MTTFALSDEETAQIYGSLRLILHECPAASIRVLAGAAGWDLGSIPDGMDESGHGCRRAPQESAIDGQWSNWNRETKQKRLQKLAEVLCERVSDAKVQRELLKSGFSLVNGAFVPVNALGEIQP